MYQKIRRLFIVTCSILSIGALNPSCYACPSETNTVGTSQSEHLNLKKQIAIKGYDPVAYFTQGKAVKGLSQFEHQHNAATYKFSSLQNLTKFKSNPSQYEPQYGGWCAYAFALGGGKVSINPKRFKIIDNKLYLFYDTLLGPNTLNKWNKTDDAEQIKKADKRWLEITS